MPEILIRSSKIKLSVIVLLYHGDRWIRTCVNSLEDQTLSRDIYEILLFDNGGSTPSIKEYERLDHIKIIRFPENYGFAEGNNIALSHASGDLILLMNQDVMVHSGCLEKLLDAFGRYPDAGAISANMWMVSEKDILDPHKEISDIVGLYGLSRLGYASYHLTRTDKDIIPVDFVSGNALCFRKAIVQDIGGYLFDSMLGSYTEDLDLSIRLKSTGWKMYVRPKALIYHFRDEAFSGNSGKRLNKLIHISANRLVVYYNNMTRKDFFKKLPALLLGIPFKIFSLDRNARLKYLMFLITLGVFPLIFLTFCQKISAGKEKRFSV